MYEHQAFAHWGRDRAVDEARRVLRRYGQVDDDGGQLEFGYDVVDGRVTVSCEHGMDYDGDLYSFFPQLYTMHTFFIKRK